MKQVQQDQLIYYILPHWGIVNAFTTKHGGVSQGHTARMNVDASKEPPTQVQAVQQNLAILGRALGFDPASLTGLRQTHTARVQVVSGTHRGNHLYKPDVWGGCDGMVTADPSLTLLTAHADCPALYMYDPVSQVIGLAHAGWRGTVGDIAAETLRQMVSLGAKPERMLAGISPGVGPCCFQVDTPVVEQFLAAWDWAKGYIQSDPDTSHKYKLDLLGINQQLMRNAGIPTANITAESICTCCHQLLFHSHRVSGFNRGNMGAILSLQPTKASSLSVPFMGHHAGVHGSRN